MRGRRSGAVVILAVLGTGLAGCGSGPSPTGALDSFATAVGAQGYPAATDDSTGPGAAALAATYRDLRQGLDATSLEVAAGPVHTTGDTATAPLTTTVTVAGLGPVVLHSTAPLRRVAGAWKVVWTTAVVDGGDGPGDHFELHATWPARAQVLGSGGASLTPAGVSVGLVGGRITDPALVTSLLEAAGFAPAAITAALARAATAPTQLTPVGVLSRSTYEAIKAQPGTTLYSVAGTAFATVAEAPLTPELGAHLVGTVGPITADQLHRLGPPYTATAEVGQGGIEASAERQLAGSPAVTALLVDARGAVVQTLGSRPATAGAPVVTSIDPTVQQAAEAAMGSLPATTQAAMVVLRASTGEVLASVSRPLTTPFDLALDGSVPPGSTFKVVTASDLVEHGASATSPATCPTTLTVDGQMFHNDEGEGAGALTLAQAFAISCNTAFIGLAAALPPASLPAVAAQYGLGLPMSPGIAVAGTSVPTPNGPNQLAATAIGQASVTVSPLAMASVAATVASGSYHPVRLVAGSADDTAAATPLPAGVAAALRQLMAGVVTGPGTAAQAGLPPGTFGKTGTAEFGAGPNPPTHAWYIGFRGDLAYAVFVYGGGTGGKVAAPLAARLLDALPAGYDAAAP